MGEKKIDFFDLIFGLTEDSDILVRRRKFRNYKVYFQDNNTVLKKDGEVFVAKCEKGEKYDAEKGLMVVLLKSLGISTSDILYLLENAHYSKKIKANKVIKCDKKKGK